ncbi:MAG: hypothetical protein JST04_14840 [Bdellovibrionales bacterium]|nr:hypothetical protein [Bdellovibrionales bacterium]
MKTSKLLPLLAVVGLSTLSACLQAASSTGPRLLHSQSAGPLSIADSKENLGKTCDSAEGKTALSDIGEGADALFQILITDIGDLNTIHERADHLATLELEFQTAFPGDCRKYGITVENTATRQDRLLALAKETDPDVVRALAKELWDLFNPNLEVHGDVGTNSGNPFASTLPN